jgi:NAD kinase
MVLPATSTIKLIVKRGNPNLTVDFDLVAQLKPGDSVKVKTDKRTLEIVHDYRNLEPTMYWLRAMRTKCRFEEHC